MQYTLNFKDKNNGVPPLISTIPTKTDFSISAGVKITNRITYFTYVERSDTSNVFKRLDFLFILPPNLIVFQNAADIIVSSAIEINRKHRVVLRIKDRNFFIAVANTKDSAVLFCFTIHIGYVCFFARSEYIFLASVYIYIKLQYMVKVSFPLNSVLSNRIDSVYELFARFFQLCRPIHSLDKRNGSTSFNIYASDYYDKRTIRN